MATNAHDPHPATIEVVRSRFLRANAIVSGDKVYEPDGDVWVIQITGKFAGNPRAENPFTNEAAPPSTVMTTIVDVGTYQGRVSASGDRRVHLQTLGNVTRLT
jgi:hypothetical protein